MLRVRLRGPDGYADYIRMAAERRLARIGADAFDLLLLHNPEYFLKDGHERSHGTLEKRRAEFARRLGEAFAWLELQVAERRIRFYGVSSNTSYVESASGVGEGARTGLSAVVTGVLFLLTTFLAPLVTVIPSEAAVPALVLVGFLMMQQVKDINWADPDIAIPAFLTIALMPFTYSISVGIGAGFLAYVLIQVVRGKIRNVHPLMWVVTVMFIVYFAIPPISSWLS